MTEHEEQALAAEIQGNHTLGGAGVVLVENARPNLLRWPDSNTYFLLYGIDSSNRDWRALDWQQNILRQFSSLGVHPVNAIFCGVLKRTYACFLCKLTGGGAGGLGKPADSQSQFDHQINQMMNNNLSFLAIQTKVQNVSQISQMMSNIAKADSDSKLNAVRNVRS